MKLFKRISVLLLTLAILIGACSCSALKDAAGDGFGGAPMSPGIGSSGFDGGTTGDSDLMFGEGESADSAEGEPGAEFKPDEEGTTVKIPAGLITAGAWNDNENYADWKALFEQNSETEKNGKFYNYTDANSWGFDSYRRLKVNVSLSDEGEPVAGAAVTSKSADGTVIFEAVTDANGTAYLFTDGEAGKVTVSSGIYTATADYTGASDEEISVKLEGKAEKKDIIDIMFVIDVTGSMGDELYFLKNEIADVINRVSESYSDATINLALLFYRDDGDKEKFAYHDFTNVTDSAGLAAVQTALDGQQASGGGDYPEAVDEALELAVGKQWNSAATTKLIFHLLDAPPHSKNTNMTRYKTAVENAAKQGIRICPILCSGAETLTEYLVRQASIYTAGTFIFVTDDSGIGGSHHDPGLPNVTVEALNSLLVRIIGGYHSGEFAPPVYYKEDQALNQQK